MSIPGQTIGISVFTGHLIKAFNLTRNQLSMAYMFGTLLSSFFLPYAGRLYDKYGARVIAPIAGFMVGLSIQVLGGWISDYVKLKYILIFHVTGIIISTAGLLVLADNYSVWMIIIGNGMASGVYGILSSMVWPRFYGTTHLGAISGFNMSWLQAVRSGLFFSVFS